MVYSGKRQLCKGDVLIGHFHRIFGQNFRYHVLCHFADQRSLGFYIPDILAAHKIHDVVAILGLYQAIIAHLAAFIEDPILTGLYHFALDHILITAAVGHLAVLVIGILIGALTIDILDGAADRICEKLSFSAREGAHKSVFLLISAIAIHNLPEGIAAGVGFGSGDVFDAIMIAGGIALQNIPEGMVLIAPMLSAGITPKRSLLLASLTGVIEVIGTFLGYFAVSIASALLPFILSYAGGCMLYVILGEMLPASRLGGNSRASNYAFLSGFAFMLIFDAIIS